jgi:hypothetical protein
MKVEAAEIDDGQIIHSEETGLIGIVQNKYIVDGLFGLYKCLIDAKLRMDFLEKASSAFDIAAFQVGEGGWVSSRMGRPMTACH